MNYTGGTTMSRKKDQPPGTVSIDQLMNRLKLSKSFIVQYITHAVSHVEPVRSTGATVLFDETDLRAWLVHHATFTRQIHRRDVAALWDKEQQQYPERSKGKTFDDYLGPIPPFNIYKRGVMPAVKVQGFDFWNGQLIFPNDYHENIHDPESNRLLPELCYRDMYRIGAIKIQLGHQRIMFYVGDLPSKNLHQWISKNLPSTEDDYPLPSAWKPYEGLVIPEKKEADSKRHIECDITVRTDIDDFDDTAILQALKSGIAITKTNTVYTDEQAYQGVVRVTASIDAPCDAMRKPWLPAQESDADAQQTFTKLVRQLRRCIDILGSDSNEQSKDHIRKLENLLWYAQHRLQRNQTN